MLPLRMRRATAPILAGLVLLSACGERPGASASRTDTAAPVADITGAGATLPYPLYAQWSAAYLAKARVHVNYESVGSGEGVRLLAADSVDFGASDVLLGTDEEGQFPRGIVQVPTAVGIIAVAVNLPEVASLIKLDASTVAEIYLGRVRRWNDPRIAALNRGARMPASPIQLIVRSDESGTTRAITTFLAAASNRWASGPGVGRSVKWPAGVPAQGSEGVAAAIKTTPGSMGFVELAYAHQNRLATVALRNRAGAYVAPSVETAASAARDASAALLNRTRVDLLDAPGDSSYPLAVMTWILVPRVGRSTTAHQAVLDFVRWGLSGGQQYAAALDYAPLPDNIASSSRTRLDSMARQR